MWAYVGAGRILHHGLREIDFRTVGGGELLQRRDVRPVRIARHRQHLDALQAQVSEHVVVAGIVHQRRVARFEQIADDELDRLAGAVREQDLAGVSGDAELAEQQDQMLAQRQIAERIAVFEQVGAVLARQRTEALSDAGLVKPRVGQPRPASENGVLSRLQQAADQPDQLLVALVIGRRGRLGCLGTCRRRVEARAPARLQIAHRDQPIVRLDHGETADIVAFGKAADRRQSRAGPQQPVVDLPLDAGDDLVGQRTVRDEGQGQHGIARVHNWPRVWTSTVMLADTRIVYVWLLKCQALSGACQADSDNTVHRRIEMPLIQVRVIKDVFSKDQKRQIIKKLTDAMVSIEGENMRGVTWVTVEEVESGDWGIGGNALTTSDVHALAAGKAA